jgi:hypothetical protein
MAILLKAISIALCERELIFEGLGKLRVGRNGEFCQGFSNATPKDQPAAVSGGFLLRHRLSENTHPRSVKR